MSKKTIYDRTDIQRVPMAVPFGEEKFEVTFLLGLPTDDELITALKPDDERDEIAAFAPLFKKYVRGCEGAEDEGGVEFSVSDLPDVVPPDVQAFAFSNALLTGYIEAKPLASGKKINWRKAPESETHTFVGFFDGANLKTTHRLARVRTAAADKAYQQMSANKYPIKFGDHEITNAAQGLCVLYDALKLDAVGYADGVVPAHHKMIVARHHFEGEREILLGK